MLRNVHHNLGIIFPPLPRPFRQFLHAAFFVGAALAAIFAAKAAPTITPHCPGYLVTLPKQAKQLSLL